MLKRLLNEPLLHFLVAGALVFAAFGRGAPQNVLQNREIAVTAADRDRLGRLFERTWGRPPSEDELRAAINDFVREEVLYRTALSLGLDKDDLIVRRRLRQKMEFLFEDTISVPQDSELRTFYAAHQNIFRTEALVSFRQIFVDAKRHEDHDTDAEELLRIRRCRPRPDHRSQSDWAYARGQTGRQKNPHPPRSLAWLSWIVARIGGWNCYYKPPGPKTMRTGWNKLAAMAVGYAIAWVEQNV